MIGTHSAFKETLMDIELRREKTIEYAEFLKEYELSLSKHQFDQEMSILQEEYQVSFSLENHKEMVLKKKS